MTPDTLASSRCSGAAIAKPVARRRPRIIVFSAFSRTWRRSHPGRTGRLWRGSGRRGARPASDGGWRARLGRSLSDGRTRSARCDAARGRVSRHLGQRPSRCDAKNGRERGAAHDAHLGWGTDTHLYRTRWYHDEFPRRLGADGPRVIKQNRGNGGQGVGKSKLRPAASYRSWKHSGAVCRRTCRSLSSWRLRRAISPMTAAYRPAVPAASAGRNDPLLHGHDKVVGFGHQFIKALIPPPPEGPASPEAQPGPRIMHPATAPISGASAEDGERMGTADDAAPRHYA